MLKRVDVAVYKAFKSAQDGAWQAGAQALGLKEDGVGYALDENNRQLMNARHGEEAGRGEGGHHRRPARGQGLLLDPK